MIGGALGGVNRPPERVPPIVAGTLAERAIACYPRWVYVHPGDGPAPSFPAPQPGRTKEARRGRWSSMGGVERQRL